MPRHAITFNPRTMTPAQWEQLELTIARNLAWMDNITLVSCPELVYPDGDDKNPLEVCGAEVEVYDGQTCGQCASCGGYAHLPVEG